jgi:leader peptidase (prepilin peptidase) / N-methyltransferase
MIPIVLVLGWLLGAGVNYLADVLPYRRRLVKPFCLNCQAEQPLLGYFFWPRTCPQCGFRRSTRVWVVEILAMATTLWLWFQPSPALGFLPGLLLLVYLAVIVVIDLEHRLILHPVSLVGAVIGLGIGTWLHGFIPTLLGGLAGFGSMLLFYFLGALFARGISRWRGEPFEDDALGFGDVTLSGVLGLILGWPGIFLGLLLAVLAGGLISLVYLIIMLATRRYRAFMAIPYGPFLVAGTVLLLYFRDFLLTYIGR